MSCQTKDSITGRFVKSAKNRRDWHKDRFTPYEGCIKQTCGVCGVDFWLPPSKIKNNVRCSSTCNAVYRERLKASKKRDCKTCGKSFYPRAQQIINGKGQYCSQRCHGAAISGDKNYLWKGGKSAAQKRSQMKRNAHIRKYKPIISCDYLNLAIKQKWKCAICKTDISEKYHRDHIVPISLGGEHTIQNIQLLCPSCNVRKKDADPIDYMQSLGFLL